MVLFPEELIKEYVEHKNANSGNFSWWKYVNFKADLQTALAFSKFFYPEIIEIEGCFLLKDKYNKELFDAWKNDCNDDKTSIEKIMNLYELKDFFHINVDYNEDLIEQNRVLGDILVMFWSMSFQHRYPSRKISVEVFEDWDTLFITVYEEL